MNQTFTDGQIKKAKHVHARRLNKFKKHVVVQEHKTRLVKEDEKRIENI
jgi:hypothetical protein